jgi:hypothetical protein
MDDDIKFRLAELERKLADETDNRKWRFETVKWLIGSLTVLFSAVALVFNFNYNTERSAFTSQFEREMKDAKEWREETKQYIKEQIGKTEDVKLELYGVNGIA